MIHFLGNGKQQVVTYGNPYLREDRILARSRERLDVQPLPYPFEETSNQLCLKILKTWDILGTNTFNVYLCNN